MKKPDLDAAGEQPSGRHMQRSRTRAHIIEATIGLLKGGASAPSAADVAKAAEVSRRTVYLHFPTLDQLLLDARLGMLSEATINRAIEAADPGGDVTTRVEAMVRAIVADAKESLPLGRALIRLTVEATEPAEPGVPRRGYRRIAWIRKALEPIGDRLPPADFERLVSALAVAIGWEALIVLEDVRGLSVEEELDTMLWMARAIIAAALAGRQQPL